jgi:hypothetical protein
VVVPTESAGYSDGRAKVKTILAVPKRFSKQQRAEGVGVLIALVPSADFWTFQDEIAFSHEQSVFIPTHYRMQWSCNGQLLRHED